MPVEQSFYDLDYEDLQKYFLSLGQPAYRTGQLWKAIYTHLEKSPENATNIPKDLRVRLSQDFTFRNLIPVQQLTSSDGETKKTLFKLPDGALIEAVVMYYDERQTLCISSQAGCAMGCVFCATGHMGFGRNLSSGEIIEQVLYFARELKDDSKSVTNIVVMGMGEPFLNYECVMNAIDRLNHPDGMNLGARRFTISTVGIVPMIIKFAQEERQVNLAISLHAANDALRSSLLPINKKYPLKELISASRDYTKATNRRITFEWALIHGVNDSIADAAELAHLIRGLLCHVNIIPLNPIAKFDAKATSMEKAEVFRQELNRLGISCTIRLRRGIDIQAGCGQLASKLAH